jgi:Tol biopolymer transport system component
MAKIYYARVDEFWRKEEKYTYLEQQQHRGNVAWQEIQPDAKHNWLTEGMRDEFKTFIPTGTKEAKANELATAEAIFKTFGGGVKTNRDTWAYNFDANTLEENIKRTTEAYNEQVFKWSREPKNTTSIDDFVLADDTKIAWSRDLKLDLERGKTAEFSEHKLRRSLYRPFTIQFLFFDRILNEEVYLFPSIFPTKVAEVANRVICLAGIGDRKGFGCLITRHIASLDLAFEKAQCFPFYTYNEDGTNRRENITDWALEQFRAHYADNRITQWDIFHYVYAMLHHPLYRKRYAANLKRELPRIPYAPDFRDFAEIGKRLGEIHMNYEHQPEYPLERIEALGMPLDWRVEKMKLSKDKRALFYNDFLTLSGTAVTLAIPYVFRRAPTEPELMRFNVPPPEKAIFAEASAISPDGRLLAFTAKETDGKVSLWIRPLDALTPKVLAGTDGAEFPFWSPDSRLIGFFADNKLKKVDVSGARPQTLCDVTGNPRGGAWNSDGTIIFAPDFTTPLYKVAAAGGAPTPITEFDPSRKENSHRWPSFLPDGRHFLYFARTAGEGGKAIFVGSLDSNERKLLFDCESLALFASAGESRTRANDRSYLLFIRNKTLMAQSFDERNLKLLGDSYPVADDIELYGESGPTGYGAFSVSADGVLSYRSGSSSIVQLVWVNRLSKQLAQVSVPSIDSEPCLSPDEKRVVFGRADSERKSSDIWMLDLARGTTTRFTFTPSAESCPLWSPDGTSIVFSSNRGGNFDLYQKNSTGTGSEEVLLQTGAELYADDWSLDGRYILYESNGPKTRFDLWVLPMTGDRKPFPFLQTEFNETHSQFSPDGRWVAYVSDESGRPEVYVQSFAPSGGKWQISTGGGDQPEWRRDGKELFYLSSSKQLMSVPIISGAPFEAGIPVQLFEVFVPVKSLTGDRNDYVIADNGQKFLVCSLVDKEIARPITVVSNWRAALKDK